MGPVKSRAEDTLSSAAWHHWRDTRQHNIGGVSWNVPDIWHSARVMQLCKQLYAHVHLLLNGSDELRAVLDHENWQR